MPQKNSWTGLCLNRNHICVCRPFGSPCPMWGCWWSWRGAGQSLLSSHSCLLAAYKQSQRRQTGRCACDSKSVVSKSLKICIHVTLPCAFWGNHCITKSYNLRYNIKNLNCYPLLACVCLDLCVVLTEYLVTWHWTRSWDIFLVYSVSEFCHLSSLTRHTGLVSNSTLAKSKTYSGSFPTAASDSSLTALSQSVFQSNSRQPEFSPVLFSPFVHCGHSYFPITFGSAVGTQSLILWRKRQTKMGDCDCEALWKWDQHLIIWKKQVAYQVFNGSLILIYFSQRLIVSLDFVDVLSQVL